ncbi:DgyrCDS14526 [Dimorphilus gyrociliatus]|uniref:DgyrCDS14526 n=1 Tax=Dimorphilus gyrociliatus TaxID=2664684 RepID=A0A7I8WDY1_9ANNE|nr:DgyrCDS14526 [Dimorphilus gyrociliatus]
MTLNTVKKKIFATCIKCFKTSKAYIYLQIISTNNLALALLRINDESFAIVKQNEYDRSRPGQKSPRTEVAQTLIEVAQSCDRSRPEV